ncbi:skin secretory protein xP2-like [Rhincodon typus]|uniref:skin secretory protein xP2-like n=1 Tax=Rhincodon typus TaxID=259920 RepID=UPI0020307DD0|nr:skin secretory protein xP2-like [Rhincodon typus]
MVMMILTKENAVRDWNELMGPTDHELAKASFPNSLRAQFDTSILRNGFHSSSSIKHARHCIKLFFGDTILDSFGASLEEELPASESPSPAASATAVESSDFVDVEAPKDEQEVTTSDTTLAPGAEIVPSGEPPDASTEGVSSPGEASGAGIEGIIVPDDSSGPGIEDMPVPGEIPDASTQEITAPSDVPESGIEDVPAPVEVAGASSEEVPAPGEAPDVSTEDVPVPEEAPDASAEDVPAPEEAPDASVEDAPAPEEAPDASAEDVPAPEEAPDASVHAAADGS